MENKIPVLSLLALFQIMWQEHWAYGADTRRGQVDCSGAFVWAYSQHGCSIYHGSNRIARTEVVELIPIKEAQIVPGMVAFKSRKKGLLTGWALPESYQEGGAHYNGDLLDYYHVGLVDEDITRVLNAQSAATGFVSSAISKGGWTHVGLLRQVDYSLKACTQEEPKGSTTQTSDASATSSITATVRATSGSTVNLRQAPNMSAKLVDRVPLGEIVTLRGQESGGWYPVRWGRKDGYMMAEFLDMANG